MDHMISYGEYMPHGMCLLWQPWLVFLWAGSDLLIFLSYTAIPLALLTVLKQRKDVPHGGLVTLFASFILLCGLTHLMGIVTLWYPIYPWVGALKLATGLVSLTTAIVLFRLVPTLVAFPSPAQMTAANDQLRDEIAAHEATLASLERQVEKRTAELKSANAMLAVQTREAVHRSSNLLAVVTSLATQTAQGAERTSDFLAAFIGRVSALARATKSIERREEASIPLANVVGESLSVFDKIQGKTFSHSGPDMVINPEAAQQISLALHELATNTQKHALSATSQVNVEISWTNDDQQFELVWRQTGGTQAEPDRPTGSTGFGTKLLTRVVPAMLRGEAEQEFGPEGLVYRLSAPLEAVVAGADGGDDDRLAARIIDQSFGIGTA